MASKRKTTSGNWEYVVKRAGLLPKPLYLTFKSEADGDEYVRHLEALLDKGIVPTEYQPQQVVLSVAQLIRQYERDAHPSDKDKGAFGPIIKRHGEWPVVKISEAWVDDWIAEMKRLDKLAPASIRARIGALARAVDWAVRKGHMQGANPLRNLPDGYAQYSHSDTAAAGIKRVDVERDRRLEPGEHERILAVLAGGTLPRKLAPLALPDPAALRCLYMLALESAMRMREIYTLELDQVVIKQRTVFLDKTKNGSKRQVPLSTVAVAELEAYLAVRSIPGGHPRRLLFPWWDGQPGKLAEVSDYLSKIFHNRRVQGVFEAAGCEGLHFHDLRHEATSRLFERTTLSEAQIMKITGHKRHEMMMRYANLRGSNLAEKLW